MHNSAQKWYTTELLEIGDGWNRLLYYYNFKVYIHISILHTSLLYKYMYGW